VEANQYKYPLIEIEWDDSVTEDGWTDVPEALEPHLTISIGFLIKETKIHILIASSYDESHVMGKLQIPKKTIKSRKEITFK
jgi:hypothetical protein